MKKLSILLFGALASAFVANAVPAKRGSFTFTQPDGTTFTASITGDEFTHYYLTDDNVPVLQGEDGYYRYADFDAVGELVLSKAKAQNPGVRSAEGTAFVKNINLDRFQQKMNLRYTDQLKQKARVAPQQGMGLFSSNYPRTGKVRCLVFLVEYTDVKFSTPEPLEYFSRLFNEEGFSDYGGTGSVRDYFLDQSNGLFDVQYDVYGPVQLAQKRSYYGQDYGGTGNDRNPEEMAIEAAEALKDQIDYSQYDFDEDGMVDNIFIVYAGMGQASGGPAESVWPHAWNIPDGAEYNGKTLDAYCCVNELEINSDPAPVGTFVHEFSHVMGLPDLYATRGNLNCTPGSWSVLDYGPYNNDGRTPPAYGAFERNAMGWLDPIVLEEPTSVELEAIHKSNECYLIPTERSNEFFLLENRQQDGWDTYIPYHGMLIWHIDFSQTVWDNNVVNNTASHQYVDIEEANNNPNTDSPVAERGYSFPGTSRNTSFTSSTVPALVSWSKRPIDMPITNIEETDDGIIKFDAAGGFIVFDTPAAPRMSASEDGKITLEWDAVEKATDYLINLYRNIDGKSVSVGDYVDYHAGNVTSLIIEGAEGETEYSATVTAAAGRFVSEPSPESSVTTPVVSLEYVSPLALSAVIDGSSAYASWHPVKGASKYLLTIQDEQSGLVETVTVDFGAEKTSITLPEGWTWSGSQTDCYKSTSTGYFGESAPSLKFSLNNATLTSPVLLSDISNVSFWLRGASAGSGSAFALQARTADGETWQSAFNIPSVNEYNLEGASLSCELPAGMRQIRFVYTKVSGNVALDDVTLTIPQAVFNEVDGLTRADVGNVTEYTLTLPEAFTSLRFFVEVVAEDGTISRPSNAVTFTVSDINTGILLPSADSEEVEYFTLQGIKVAHPGTGLYIRRQGASVSKVYIK